MFYDDHDYEDERLPVCTNCGKLYDEPLATDCGPVCSRDCRNALETWLAEAAPSPAVRVVRDYLDRDIPPF